MKRLECARRQNLAILLTLTVLGLVVVPAAFAGEACAGAQVAPTGSTVRGWDAEVMSWRVELTDPGILSLEASGPQGLELTAWPCSTASERIVLQETSTRLIFAVLQAGDWLVEVRGRRVMPRVKLTADFRMGNRAGDVVASELVAAALATPHEVDPDPAAAPPPLGGPGGSCCFPQPTDTQTALEDEHEVDPDPATVSWIPAGTARWCWRPQPTDDFDDHADTFACASPLPLGRPVAAELRNAWGDDEDVYRFTLGETRRVRVGVVGETGLAVGLYDGFGQRLEQAVSGSRLVRMLLPGTYFVRVGGESEGSYVVAVE